MTKRIYTIPYESVTHEGITYRSKLELRWHIFLDTLGIVHTYEPKRFVFPEFYGTDCYIYSPDFALLSCPFNFIEIKPTLPLVNEYAKCRILSSLGYSVALLAGGCNPDVTVYLFQDGSRKYIKKTSVFLQQCFQFKLNGRQGETVVALKMVLGKRGNFAKAFEAAYKFKA